jgi:hypothetical protein
LLLTICSNNKFLLFETFLLDSDFDYSNCYDKFNGKFLYPQNLKIILKFQIKNLKVLNREIFNFENNKIKIKFLD